MEEETLSNSFYKASITLMAKPKMTQEKKRYMNIPYEYRRNNRQQNTTKLNPVT